MVERRQAEREWTPNPRTQGGLRFRVPCWLLQCVHQHLREHEEGQRKHANQQQQPDEFRGINETLHAIRLLGFDGIKADHDQWSVALPLFEGLEETCSVVKLATVTWAVKAA